MVFDQLFEAGVSLEQGIFFFLFIAALSISYGLVYYVLKKGERREKALSAENNARELRYIETISRLADSLSKVDTVNHNVSEMRSDLHESNERQERMIGRLLDRLSS